MLLVKYANHFRGVAQDFVILKIVPQLPSLYVA